MYFQIITQNEKYPKNEAGVKAIELAKAHALESKDESGETFLLKITQLSAVCELGNDWREIVKLIGATFSDGAKLNDENFPSSVPNATMPLGVDLVLVSKIYEKIMSLGQEDSLVNACELLLNNLQYQAEVVDDPAKLKQFVVMLQSPLLIDPGYAMSITQNLIVALDKLRPSMKEIIQNVFAGYDKQRMEDTLDVLHQFITVRLYSERAIDKYMLSAVKIMAMLAKVNETSGLLNMSAFYNDAINGELDMDHDYSKWQKDGDEFCFCNYPFILDPSSKARVLQADAQDQMRKAAVESVMLNFDLNPHLVLRVYRDNLVHSTLAQINFDRSLKKSLKVVFVGEEAVDEGGVTKEFFQLLVAELLNPEFGMFSYSDEHMYMWFNAHSFESGSQFRLIGAILGMAIYNSVILDITFPLVVFKKLLGGTDYQVTLEDLYSYDRELYLGFKTMLEFEGDVENTFCRNFTVESEWLGETIVNDLKEGGSEIPVTGENREEYVQLYVDWVLNKSIETQFTAFAEGFDQVCGGEALKLCRPEELELLICGSRDLDFEALERGSVYDEGLNSDHPLICKFWEVLHEFNEEQKRKFLKFTTGTDRVPIKGLGNMQFVITRSGPDSERLPTAHTCFNHLLIPEYDSKEKLKAKLEFAMENDRGFGMI